MIESDPVTALQAILQKVKPTELARRIGVTSQAISQWKRVPAERVVDVETATGVPREKLRPDLFRKTERAA